MRSLGVRLTASVRPLSETFRNPGLRRLQLAWVGSILGTWSYLVALVVYAYGQGGADAVALVGFLRMVPAAALAPFTSTLADRIPRRLVLVGADVIRAVLMGAAAATIGSGGPAWIVYAIVVVSQVVGTPFRPAQAALLPALARTPGELTAANVASSTLEAVGFFAGPAAGGFVLVATNAQTVFALNGASFVWSALLVLGIRVGEPVAARRRRTKGQAPGYGVTAGFRVILGDRRIAILIGLYAGQTLIAGAMSVFAVVTGLELLDGNAATVGLLNASLGVGGLVGGFVALTLATRGRLAADFGLGLALFGAPFALIGLAPRYAPALLAMGVVGLGNSLVDISAVTLLQRTVPDEVLGRTLGVVQGVLLGSIGLGALAAPLLIHALGARTALVVAGAFLPLLALLGSPSLRRLDASTPEPALVSLLRGVEILAPLPPATLDRLARSLVDVRLPAGSDVVRKGDAGDRFYMIEEGEVKIEGNTFGPGSSFGEIALLRDVPRTATVTATTDVILRALERDHFLAAVTGHEPSTTAADAIIARRLGDLRADLTTAPGAA